MNTPPESLPKATETAGPARSPMLVWASAAVAVAALALSALLWQKVLRMQEQLARQSTDAGKVSLEAKAWARQAQDSANETAGRLGLMEGRLAEVALQRNQLDTLIQTLSRSRDEQLLVETEATLRTAHQHAALTGSTEPLVAALQAAQQRLQRAALPRLAPVQRAIDKDLERVRGQAVLDLPGLLLKLDEAVALTDGLVWANQPRPAAEAATPRSTPEPGWPQWALAFWRQLSDPVRGLVRLQRIDQPEAMLLAPEQAFFLRENLKLKLLNARLGLLARQLEGVRADLQAARAAVWRYGDPGARKNQQLLQLIEQAQQQLRGAEPARLEASLAAINTLAAAAPTR